MKVQRLAYTDTFVLPEERTVYRLVYERPAVRKGELLKARPVKPGPDVSLPWGADVNLVEERKVEPVAEVTEDERVD